MFRKVITSMLTLVLFFSMSVAAFAQESSAQESSPNLVNITLGDGKDLTSIEIEIGQSVSIPLQLIESDNVIRPRETFPFPGDGGVLTLTATPTSVNYNVALTIPATSFSGILRITDITSGLVQGNFAVSGFSGSVPYAAYKGHRYHASLDGTAFLGITPVAKTVYNQIYWNINL